MKKTKPSKSPYPKPIPKWLLKHFSRLWFAFHEKPYSFKEAQSVLGIQDPRSVGTILSRLFHSGWICKRYISSGKRKLDYQNLNPQILLGSIGKAVGEGVFDARKGRDD